MSAPPIPFYDSEEEEADERRAALKRYLELDLGDDTYIQLAHESYTQRIREEVMDGGYMTTSDMRQLAGAGILDDPEYLSLAELQAGEVEPGYMSILEMQKAAGHLPKEADYLSIMQVREALSKLTMSDAYMSLDEIQAELAASKEEPSYLSVLEMQATRNEGAYMSLDEVKAEMAKEEPSYLSVLEMQKAAGKLDQATVDYLTLVDIQKARGQLPADADYMSVAELFNAGGMQPEEPEYMSIDQIQALGNLCKPTDEEAAYMSIDEIQSLVSDFKEKIKDEEPEYLSIAEMASLAGPIAFKAWVSEAAEAEVVERKKSRSKPPRKSFDEEPDNSAWLRRVRDEIIRQEISKEKEQEDRDLELARALQKEEVLLSMEEELAKEEVYLNALENLYDQVVSDSKLKIGSFLSMAGASLLKDRTTGEPDFAVFEKRCGKVLNQLAKAQALLAEDIPLDREAVFYSAAKVVKAIQRAYTGLGDAAMLDLGDNIQQRHLHQLGANVWHRARHFGPKSRKTSQAHVDDLRSAFSRLEFVINRLLFEREGPLDVTPAQIQRRVEMKQKKVAKRNARKARRESMEVRPAELEEVMTPWACTICTLDNDGTRNECEACGSARDSNSTPTRRKRHSKQRLRIKLTY